MHWREFAYSIRNLVYFKGFLFSPFVSQLLHTSGEKDPLNIYDLNQDLVSVPSGIDNLQPPISEPESENNVVFSLVQPCTLTWVTRCPNPSMNFVRLNHFLCLKCDSIQLQLPLWHCRCAFFKVNPILSPSRQQN